MNWYLLASIAAVAFVIWAMVDIFRRNFSPSEKIMWFALAVFFPIVGPTIYYFTGHRK